MHVLVNILHPHSQTFKFHLQVKPTRNPTTALPKMLYAWLYASSITPSSYVIVTPTQLLKNTTTHNGLFSKVGPMTSIYADTAQASMLMFTPA